VGTGGEIAPDAVLDLLADLVVKSLVVVDGETGRYRLLETVRQYAQERLEVSGDQDATRSRHLAFYVDLAEAARPALLGPQQAAWLARLDVERENLLSAHLGCERAERGGELGLRLVSAMKQYFFKRGLLGLGHRVMAETLAHPGAQMRNVERSRALFGVGQVCNALGRYAEALTYLEESLAIAREIGDRTRRPRFSNRGLALEGLGDVAGARTYLDEASFWQDRSGTNGDCRRAQQSGAVASGSGRAGRRPAAVRAGPRAGPRSRRSGVRSVSAAQPCNGGYRLRSLGSRLRQAA
jgi:tetratricopeptide (TPR) repeat protein